MNRKKPHKIDLDRALSETPPPRGGATAEEEIEIVEVVGGEPGEQAAPQAEAPAQPAAEEPREAPELAGARAGAQAAESAVLLERLKRLQAEHENYRKRVERDREEYREQAAMALVRDLLPVLDSFERALARKEGAGDAEFHAGIALIHRQLAEALGRLGLERMEALGQPFDPEFHDAVVTTRDPQAPPGRVLEVFDRGYRFRGRLLRPARVRVAADPGEGDRGKGSEGR